MYNKSFQRKRQRARLLLNSTLKVTISPVDCNLPYSQKDTQGSIKSEPSICNNRKILGAL